jgi:hypothetical protein
MEELVEAVKMWLSYQAAYFPDTGLQKRSLPYE